MVLAVAGVAVWLWLGATWLLYLAIALVAVFCVLPLLLSLLSVVWDGLCSLWHRLTGWRCVSKSSLGTMSSTSAPSPVAQASTSPTTVATKAGKIARRGRDAVLYCPDCRAKYTAHDHTCRKCGTALVDGYFSAPCQSCGAINRIDRESCWSCWENLSAPAEPDDAGTTWRCKNCGEENEEQFQACWNCCTERDAVSQVDDDPTDNLRVGQPLGTTETEQYEDVYPSYRFSDVGSNHSEQDKPAEGGFSCCLAHLFGWPLILHLIWPLIGQALQPQPHVDLSNINWAAMSPEPATFSGKVVGITDGDAITLLLDQGHSTVRLYGIDCPDIHQAYGAQAKKATSALAFGKVASVEIMDVDNYGRKVAVVTLPGNVNLNQKLVKQGMAWWHTKAAPDSKELSTFENRARKAKIGLWSQPNPVPPWKFRGGGRQPSGK